MKKNLLFGLLTILAAGFGFGGISMADTIAQIGDTPYESLADAIEAANGDNTITLLTDVPGSFTLDHGFTLNLNGNKISGTLTLNGGELIVNDENNEGGIGSITVNGGNLILNGGTYRSTTAVFVSGEGSTATINRGIYTALCGNTAAIYAYDSGSIDIYGGEYYGETQAQTEENGGSCANGTTKQGKVFYGGAQGSGPTRSAPGTVKVHGGTFDGRISASEDSIYKIDGGTFVGNTVAKTAACSEFNGGNNDQQGCNETTLDEFLIDGYEVAESNGNYEVSEIQCNNITTIKGLNYCLLNSNVSSLTLGSNIPIGAVTVSRNLTLDLNGHTISGKLTLNGGELIVNDENNEGGIGSITVNGGNLILNGGTYRSTTAVFVSGEGSTATINGGIYTALCGNTAAIYAYDSGSIDIYGGEYYGETQAQTEENGGSCANGTTKQGKVFYGGAQGSGPTRSAPGTVKVHGGTFDGRISASEDSIYKIDGGTFVGNTVAKTAACSEFNGGNNNQVGCNATTIDEFLVLGYTVFEKGTNHVVELLADAAIDQDNKSSVQIAEGTTITTGGATVELNDIYDFLSGSTDGIKTGDSVSIPSSENGDILDAGNENLSIQGKLSLDFGETAKFSRPVAIRIAVNGNNGMRVKVKHNGGKFGFDGLAENADADCDNGKAATYIYQGGLITPINGYVVIYTCSASTFVAYTETAKVTPASGTGRPAGGSSSSTTTKKDDTQVIELKGEVTEESTTTGEVKEENTKSDVIISDAAKAAYNDEQLAAYQWAYDNGITTINDVDKARLSDPLTRAELAKMMSQYISSVLKKSPIKADKPEYKDVDESLGDLADFIVKAYQYQIMGINADGSALENFNPNGLVTRAEFATVFSRVLYGDKNNQAGADYYSKHLAALKEAGILSNDDPTIQEVRGWVMLMMYRSVNPKVPTQEEPKAEEGTGNNVGIANPASTYCVEQEGKIEIREDAEGAQYGVCKFKDGTEVEEWEYFRANHKDETTTGAVAESSTGDVAENTTGAVAEATTGAAENN